MPRNVIFECNKLHGFIRMNSFTNSKIAPCVNSRHITKTLNFSLIPDTKYTIKEVKENTVCSNCTNECKFCENFDCFYEDFNLNIIIGADKNKIIELLSSNETYYFYKYFDSDLFGKLIIGYNYYTIEAVDNYNNNDCYESHTIWKNDVHWKFDDFELFKEQQVIDIILYAQRIREEMSLYIDAGYSIILNFAFTNTHYFNHKKFPNTNLLFYGMRSAFNQIDLEQPILI